MHKNNKDSTYTYIHSRKMHENVIYKAAVQNKILWINKMSNWEEHYR